MALVTELTEHVRRSAIDLVYLPFSTRTADNLGFAFANFVDTETANSVLKAMDGQPWKLVKTTRSTVVLPAHIQGFHNNLEHCAGTIAPVATGIHLPLIFHDGEEIPFHAAVQTYLGRHRSPPSSSSLAQQARCPGRQQRLCVHNLPVIAVGGPSAFQDAAASTSPAGTLTCSGAFETWHATSDLTPCQTASGAPYTSLAAAGTSERPPPSEAPCAAASSPSSSSAVMASGNATSSWFESVPAIHTTLSMPSPPTCQQQPLQIFIHQLSHGNSQAIANSNSMAGFAPAPPLVVAPGASLPQSGPTMSLGEPAETPDLTNSFSGIAASSTLESTSLVETLPARTISSQDTKDLLLMVMEKYAVPLKKVL